MIYARLKTTATCSTRAWASCAARLADGKWREPFNAYELNWADYTEATAWQYTFFVPQNMPALIKLMGGDRHSSTRSTRCSPTILRSLRPSSPTSPG